MRAAPAAYHVYVGTYTSKGAVGIYQLRLDARTGALAPVGAPVAMPNPTFLALHPDGRHLYAVSEVRDSDGRRGGAVAAFALDGADGVPRLLNRASSGGNGPCHVAVHPSGQAVLVANYGSGSAALLPVRADGTVGEASDVVQHHGTSVNPKRQEGPHAHSFTLAPDGRYAVVADLGLDKLLAYRLDLAAGRLVPADPPGVSVAPGAGPRHLAFAADGRHAYLVTEMGNTVIAYDYDAARGAFTERQTLPTLPADFTTTSYGADIHLSPDGRHLYASNRGHESLAIYAVAPGTGRLTPAGFASTLGKWPRNFAVTPDGALVLAANQDSDNIVVFRRDAATGALTPTGHTTTVSMPVCVVLRTAE